MWQRRRVEIVRLSTWGTGVLIGVRYRGARALSSQRAVSMIMGEVATVVARLRSVAYL